MSDSLKPKIPDGAARRFIGGASLLIGALMFFGGPPWPSVGGVLFNLGAALLIWGSLLQWLRVLEDRQIEIQKRQQG
jgi:hypothetical protein